MEQMVSRPGRACAGSDWSLGATQVGESWREGRFLFEGLAVEYFIPSSLTHRRVPDPVLWLFPRFQRTCKLLEGRAGVWLSLGLCPAVLHVSVAVRVF